MVDVAAIAGFGLLLRRWSTGDDWSPLHQLAAAAGALVSIGVVAFTVDPLGDPSDLARYTTNAVLLAVVIAVIAVAVSRQPARHLSLPSGEDPRP